MVDPEQVSEILLADGWHKVDETPPGFELVTHGFSRNTQTPGFLMPEVNHFDDLLTGPLTSILAVRYKAKRTQPSNTPTSDAFEV